MFTSGFLTCIFSIFGVTELVAGKIAEKAASLNEALEKFETYAAEIKKKLRRTFCSWMEESLALIEKSEDLPALRVGASTFRCDFKGREHIKLGDGLFTTESITKGTNLCYFRGDEFLLKKKFDEEVAKGIRRPHYGVSVWFGADHWILDCARKCYEGNQYYNLIPKGNFANMMHIANMIRCV